MSKLTTVYRGVSKGHAYIPPGNKTHHQLTVLQLHQHDLVYDERTQAYYTKH